MTLTHPASAAERAAAELVERALISADSELSVPDALALHQLLREHQARGDNLSSIARQRDDVRFELGRVAAERDAARELLVRKERLLGEAVARLRAAAVELELLRAQVKS